APSRQGWRGAAQGAGSGDVAAAPARWAYRIGPALARADAGRPGAPASRRRRSTGIPSRRCVHRTRPRLGLNVAPRAVRRAPNLRGIPPHAYPLPHHLCRPCVRHASQAGARCPAPSALRAGRAVAAAVPRPCKPYLEGSKAPDNRFKDFKNHVLHPRDGFWGGAPDKVRSWYGQLVDALGQEQWATAAYAAGVLSHYYTDPLQPFHTGQSEAENNIHRAVEWSISKAYDALARQGEQEFAALAVEVPPGPNWLAELVCRNAQLANGSYEKLIAHYDFQRGVVDPPAGLDPVARRLIARLIRHATLGLAAVLDRAIGDCGTSPPHVPLAAATVAAMAQVPFRLIARRIADAEERRTIERMYDELIATGTVEVNLPEDDRMVRDLHALEVLSVRPPLPEVSKLFPIEPSRASGGPGAPPASQ